MKTILTVIALICSNIISSQNISDYKYIYVPKQFDKKVDYPKVKDALIKSLTQKKYTITQEDIANWPPVIADNKCLVANAKLLDDGTFLRNRIILQFNDCNGKLITEVKGSSNEKDFELGLKDALITAMNKVPNSDPKEIIAKLEDVKSTVTKSEATETPVNKAKTGNYSNGNINLQLVNINKDEFILVKSNSESPYATFRKSTLDGVYHVILDNGTHTIGYFENNNIIIDASQNQENYKKEIFLKK